MQDVVAALERPAQRHGRIELLQLRLQLLVDQQQRLQRTVDVAIATRHNLVDGSFDRFGTHRKTSNFMRRKVLAPVRVPVDCVDRRRPRWGALATWQNCVEVMSLYEAHDDAYMTVRIIVRDNCLLAAKPGGCKTVPQGCPGPSGPSI